MRDKRKPGQETNQRAIVQVLHFLLDGWLVSWKNGRNAEPVLEVRSVQWIMACIASIDRCNIIGPIYLAAVLEYLSAEILELAGKAAKEKGLVTSAI